MSETETTADAPADGATTEATKAAETAAPETKAADTAPAEQPAKPAEADWRESIGDDQQLRDFAGRFATPGDLARTALDLRQKLGKAVVIPGKDATEDEVKAYRKATGVPDEPTGYKVTLPEDLPDELKPDEAGQQQLQGFLAAMHNAGATQGVVDAALSHYYGMAKDAMAGVAASSKQAVEDGLASLQQEWGGDYQANVNAAASFARQFGGDEFMELLETAKLDGVPMGDHPAIIKVFASAGRRLGEDGFHASDLTPEGRSTAQERINELTELMTSNPAKYRSKAVQDELHRLYESLEGDGPIVGAAGRTV